MAERTRREFLDQGARAAFVGVLGATPPDGARAEAQPRKRWWNHWGMLVDLRRCIGCQACTVACKAENGVPLGVFRRRVRTVLTGRFPNVGRHFVPISCFHCEEPPCLEACAGRDCFAGQEDSAIHQTDDGYVVIDKEKCAPDEKPCLTACPYHNIFYDPVADKADKCTFCVHRVSRGLAPACVQTCEGGALLFGDLRDPDSAIARAIASNETTVLRPEQETRPSLHYIGLEPDVRAAIERDLARSPRLEPQDLEEDR